MFFGIVGEKLEIKRGNIAEFKEDLGFLSKI